MFLQMFRFLVPLRVASSHTGTVAGMSIAGYSKVYLDFYKIGLCLSLLVANLALVRFDIIYYLKTH